MKKTNIKSDEVKCFSCLFCFVSVLADVEQLENSKRKEQITIDVSVGCCDQR